MTGLPVARASSPPASIVHQVSPARLEARATGARTVFMRFYLMGAVANKLGKAVK